MKIKRLKLYHFPASRSARVRWMLHEVVGDDFEVERVAVYDGALFTPEMLAINPNHGVPILEITWEDDRRQHMLESAAMVAFLADAYPALELAPVPQASPERADYLQMLHFGGSAVDMVLWQVRVHEHMLPEAERDPRTVARYRKKFVDEIEPQIARRLERGPYICGERFSAADCVVGHCVFWARGYGLCRDEVFRSYVSRLSKRPAFAAAFADVRDFTFELPRDKGLAERFTG